MRNRIKTDEEEVFIQKCINYMRNVPGASKIDQNEILRPLPQKHIQIDSEPSESDLNTISHNLPKLISNVKQSISDLIEQIQLLEKTTTQSDFNDLILEYLGVKHCPRTIKQILKAIGVIDTRSTTEATVKTIVTTSKPKVIKESVEATGFAQSAKALAVLRANFEKGTLNGINREIINEGLENLINKQLA